MNMNHLRIFYAVAEADSIRASAERLHISQPAVTRSLKDFETSLGMCLFNRPPHSVQPKT
jgi:DNA-binding transcriptional LysR family regulator